MPSARELTSLRTGIRLPSLRAPVAQLDRASVFGTEGWGFKSLRVYFLNTVITSTYADFITNGILPASH